MSFLNTASLDEEVPLVSRSVPATIPVGVRTKIAVVPWQIAPTSNTNERVHMAISYLRLDFLGFLCSGLTLRNADTASSYFMGRASLLLSFPFVVGRLLLSDRDCLPPGTV